MPMGANTSGEFWSADIHSSYWGRSLVLNMVSYSHVCNIMGLHGFLPSGQWVLPLTLYSDEHHKSCMSIFWIKQPF